ncbi:MAG: hypothetical protein EA374_00875 [Acholeplasmatales bacterium]|nr:MAG: hypothetical protein EA374_00875 [Acholeplasmatales bacterium]
MKPLRYRIALQYGSGVLILVLGVVMMIRSQFGPAPWDTFTFHLHSLLGVTLGTSALIIQTGLILVIMLVRRSWAYLKVFVSIVCISVSLDFWNILVFGAYLPTALLMRIFLYAGGMWLLSFGLSLLILSSFKAAAVDEIMLLYMDLLKCKTWFVPRIMAEATGLTLGVMTGLIGGLGLGIINLGTLFVMVTLPFLLSLQMRWMGPVFTVGTTKNNTDAFSAGPLEKQT